MVIFDKPQGGQFAVRQKKEIFIHFIYVFIYFKHYMQQLKQDTNLNITTVTAAKYCEERIINIKSPRVRLRNLNLPLILKLTKSFPRIFEFKSGLSRHHDSALAPWQLPLFCISARLRTAVEKLIRLRLY